MSVNSNVQFHTPVLLRETIDALQVRPGGRYIDCTLNSGGHGLAILENSFPRGKLLGIDMDPEAIALARERLRPYGDNVFLANENFANIEAICTRNKFCPVQGILFDLGMSSRQLTQSERGFSFQSEGPINMCFNPGQQLTAADIVNNYPEEELAELLKTYGEERSNRRIARYIVNNRPLTTTLELARVIERAVGGRRGRIHPATRTFQALRIFVNRELENLGSALKQVVHLLAAGGRLVIISYHSLEDRLAKEFLKQESGGYVPCLSLITKRVITASDAEIKANPRSRSAKLRAAQRL